MEREVRIGRREATLVLSRRPVVRLSEIGTVLGSAFGEVYGYLEAHGVEPKGPPFVIYHGTPVADDPFEVEVCAPVGRATDGPPGWSIRELPAGTFATMLHVGPYETVGSAYDTMTTWLGAHDLTVMGPPREVYLSEPGTPPEQIRTVIEFPVAAAAAPATAR